MTHETLASARPVEAPVIHISPVGRHTRYMLAAYLRHVLMVTSALLAIALTIDLWPQLNNITQSAGKSVFAAVWQVLRFSLLRTPGLVAPFLSFATFLGVLWTEVVFTQSGERMLIWNSGRSPIQCLMPALILGIIVGLSVFVLDAELGPAAMGVQMRERLGLDGVRLDRTRIDKEHWIQSTDGLLRAQVQYGPPSVLINPTVYKFDSHGELSEVDMAASATQAGDGASWVMHGGRYWQAHPGGQENSGRVTFTLGVSAGESMVPFDTRTVKLRLDPLWLSVFGMETQYIPLSVLRPLARTDVGPLSKGSYRTRLQVLYGELFLPIGMALLAASMSMLLFPYRTPPVALLGVLMSGYIAHFAIKACLLMGQNGYMPPLLAGWLVPTALFTGTFFTLRAIERRRTVVAQSAQ
jgi:lipopolysaccharide export LptBFGC system permease protein LptF